MEKTCAASSHVVFSFSLLISQGIAIVHLIDTICIFLDSLNNHLSHYLSISNCNQRREKLTIL